MVDQDRLTIDEVVGDFVVISFSEKVRKEGKLPEHRARKLLEEFDAYLSTYGANQEFCVNLGNFCLNSAYLGSLIEFRKKTPSLKVVTENELTQETFNITKLANIYTIYSSYQEFLDNEIDSKSQ
ncbi:MAG: hypothetical protein KKC75_03055 [Nanoarchaeota archaeon]|nr:hypothetical protein [Nanoarchaeota archaeon]